MQHNWTMALLFKSLGCWCLCMGLTGIVVAVADNEHEQQPRENGCKEHPAYSCSNHSRVHIGAWFRCNTSQLHIAKWYTSGKAQDTCYKCLIMFQFLLVVLNPCQRCYCIVNSLHCKRHNTRIVFKEQFVRTFG